MFFSSSCLVMKHEVIYYDNSIDKEGHAAEPYSLTDVCLPSFRGCVYHSELDKHVL